MSQVDQADGAEGALVAAKPSYEDVYKRSIMGLFLKLAKRAAQLPTSAVTDATISTVRRLVSVPEAKPVRLGCCPGSHIRQPRIYLAGPMRGYLANNAAAFFAAQYEWQAAGWEVMNPLLMDLERPLVNETDLPDANEAGTGASPNFRLLVLRDCEAIIQKADAVAFLNGHSRSEGATAEWHLASWLNLSMYYQEEDGSWR